ncbi:hypothetical protein BGAL_0252g00200 [Botrytis galanthina]|uniref:Uncharacterized protein n=1 Tax=Botrytis galanthina TaxID=278940 RepID=A0A4S8QTD5_9HELO|nr:hypothetical protein BGAL_0252g00200 [Botrytis galanthina]
MNQESATPELSSGERNVYSPATVPPSMINTQKQKACLWAQPGEPKSTDPEIQAADTDTSEQSCTPEIPEAPSDTDTVELSCSPEDSYKKLYAEMYKKAYNEAYQKACWDSFNRSYTAGFNAKFTDHYMKAYIRNRKQDALMKLDLDKIPFPNGEESTVFPFCTLRFENILTSNLANVYSDNTTFGSHARARKEPKTRHGSAGDYTAIWRFIGNAIYLSCHGYDYQKGLSRVWEKLSSSVGNVEVLELIQ